MADLVLTTIEEGIATLTLNRPEARNALSPELIEAMNAAVEALGRQAAGGGVRVMILGGTGKSFCAGMDLKGVLSDPKKMAEMLRGLSRFSRAVRRLPIPTIARVQGAAVGGGCGLMVVTDFAITHPEAKVGYPEVDLGVCPAVVAPWLIKKIGAGGLVRCCSRAERCRARKASRSALPRIWCRNRNWNQPRSELAANCSRAGRMRWPSPSAG